MGNDLRVHCNCATGIFRHILNICVLSRMLDMYIIPQLISRWKRCCLSEAFSRKNPSMRHRHNVVHICRIVFVLCLFIQEARLAFAQEQSYIADEQADASSRNGSRATEGSVDNVELPTSASSMVRADDGELRRLPSVEQANREPAGFGFGPGMGGPGMGGPGYSATWYPSSPVSDSNPSTHMGIVRQSLSGAFPLWTNGRDMCMFSVGVQNSLFSTDAVLPDSHQAFPEELWNISLGTNYMHKFDNGWMGMVGINFGSASDKPFHSIDEMNVGFMSFLQMPAKNERDKWNFMLMYSPIGSLNFPIPGVAYLWNPSDRFHASIGIPFSVSWRATDALTFDVSYMPLVTVNAMATYKFNDQLSLYGGFQSLQEGYLLADRENTNDRFMGFEKRLIAGVRWAFYRHATLDLSGGYSFDRYYGIGQNQIGGNLSDQVNIDPGPFASMSFQYRF